MENRTNTLEQPVILTVLQQNQALSARLREHTAAIVTDIGTEYIDRIEVRCGHALSRPEFTRLSTQVAQCSPYFVESVRWGWAPDDVTIRSFTLAAHRTPNPHATD